MVSRFRVVTIQQTSTARSAAVGSTASLDGDRYRKVADDRWESDTEARGDADMLRGRLNVRQD